MSDQDIYSNIDTGDPNDVFKVMAGIGTWGGRSDYESGQDSGETAGGKLTYDPATGEEPTTPRIAVDPTWIKRGIINYGDKVVIQNPKTGAQQEVEVQDAGPARWTGRGFDIDEGTRQSLGLETDDKAVVDFRPALLGQKQAPQDLTTSEGAQSYLAQAAQRPENMTAQAGRQSGAVQDITVTDPELEKVTKLPDGGYDLGDGVIGYPNGIFQKRAGNFVTQYTPDSSQPTGYKTNSFTVKAQDKDPMSIMKHEGAKKGVVREDYPEGSDGDKQYRDELKLTLGAGVADDIAEAIMSGKQPPDTKGLYRTGPQVRAKLAKLGYDLKEANLDWQAAQKFILGQNSPPLIRLRQSAQTAYHSLEVIDDLAKQWKGGKFPPLNKARLVAAQQGVLGPEAASIARQLDGQITDLTFELGNVYMGGNTPTDQSLKLAGKNLSADWDEKVLLDMTNLARTNLSIRLNSFKQVEPAGMSEEGIKESRWATAHPEAATKQSAPSATPSYRVGQTVKLKNGQSVVIKSILPNGDIEY